MGDDLVWTFDIGWTAAGVCSDGDYVYAMQDHLDKVWKLNRNTGNVVDTFHIPGAATGFYGGLVCIPGRLYYGEGLTGLVRIYDLATNQQIGSFQHVDYIQNVSFDGQIMYISANNSTVYRYQLLNGNLYGEPLKLQPGARLVLGVNDALQTNGEVAVQYVYDDFILGNEDDEVLLTTPDGTLIDAVHYTNDGYPDLPGHSLSLSPLAETAGGNDEASNWCSAENELASGDHGTPGELNPGCP
jgi:hypothetical protein